MSFALLLLLVSPAWAAPASLAPLDAEVEALRRGSLPREVDAVHPALKALTEGLKRATVLATDLPESERSAGRLRLAEAFLYSGRQFVDGACPTSLEPDACAVYAGALADRAIPFLDRSEALLAEVVASELRPRDRKRLKLTTREAAKVRARATANLRPAPTPAPAPRAEGGPHITRPENPFENRWGLVWRDAVFAGAGQSVRSEPPGRERVAGRDALWLVRILEEGDDYATVQAAARTSFDQHCASARALGRSYGVWFLVDRADFVPVVSRSLDLTHEGLTHRVEAGAPVFPGGVLLDEFLVDLPLPEDAVSWWYRAFDLPERSGAREGGVPGASVRVPGATVTHLSPGYSPDGRVTLAEYAEGVGRWEGRCGVLSIRTDVEPTPNSYLLGSLGSDAPKEPRVHLQAGTPIFAPDGPLAGVLTSPISPKAAALGGGERRCLTLEFGDEAYGGEPRRGTPLTLCFDAGDVRDPG